MLDSSDESAHDWSLGDLEGIYSIPLDEVRDDMTRLLHCPPTAASSVDTLWFSLTVDSDELIAGKRNEALTDWRLVISPPLVLVNQLPLPGSIMVWEGAPGSHNMVERMTERVGSGERIAVHTADVRRPVSFTLYLQGYDWAETSPAVLTSGVSGEVHMTHDRARIVREAGSIPVEVFIQRDFQMGAWLLESKAQQTPSDVVAQGVPLAVTLLAPLWIVNATSLAIDAAVVQVPPPPTVRPLQELTYLFCTVFRYEKSSI